jgi:hypothetical protein
VALAGATAVASPIIAAAATRRSLDVISLRAPAPIARLHADADGSLVAISTSGDLWRLERAAWRALGRGLDVSSPLATGHGRVVGRGLEGGLWVLESGRATRHTRPALAPHAGLLVLALAVIAVAAREGRHHVVRLEPGARGWTETARSEGAVLPDARPVQFDPTGTASDDNGHVAVFGGPNTTRYRHGVLGDDVEATSLLLLERHSLDPLARLDLAEPFVFEDIAPRPVVWRGTRALLTVRSVPLGAQLAVAAPDSRQPGRFALAALGEPLGTPQRWMSPTTDGTHLCAVHTPHIGGVLHCYQAHADKLVGDVLARDVSNHTIGQRDLDTSAWVGRHWVAPTQDRRGLRILDIASRADAGASREVDLGQPVAALQRWTREGHPGVAVLLQDRSVVWAATAS